jgi:hypothetical protein
MVGEKFSAGADVYWSSLFFFLNELEAGVFGRFYPQGRIFFVEAGLGYHVHNLITGFAITPALGWKIDIDNPGGFFIRPGINIPVTFGGGIGFLPYFSLGGAL